MRKTTPRNGLNFNFRMSPPLRDALRRMAERESNSVGAVIRRLVMAGIEREAVAPPKLPRER
jgi:hypothetical protein